MEPTDYLILAILTAAGTLASLVLLTRRDALGRSFLAIGHALGQALLAAFEGLRSLRARPLLVLAFAVAMTYGLANREARETGLPLLLIAGSAAILFAMAWTREFLFLMALRDEDLPGRFDKPIWVFFLVALAPIGVLLFRAHRLAHWPEPALKAKRAALAARELA